MLRITLQISGKMIIFQQMILDRISGYIWEKIQMVPPLFLSPNFRQYPEEAIQMINTFKEVPKFLIMKEMQNKTIYYFRPMILERTKQG